MLQLRIPSAFPSGGGVRGRSTPPVSPSRRKPGLPPLDLKEDTPANPSLVTGISWGCLRVVDGNAGTVSSFPARTTVARHDRFCLQVLAWLVRPCGFDACPSCVSSSWSTPPPGSQARVKPKAQAVGEAGLDLSKEHLRTQELESCAPVADTFGLSFLRGGVRGRSTPPVSPSRRKPGLRCR